ncbi:MAG: hypothetical protein ACOC1E_00190 [Marinilabiliaceae bacterium]
MDKTLPRAPLLACILLIFPFVFSSASSAILQEKDLVTRLSNRDQISRTEIKELDSDEIETFLHRFDSAIAGDEGRFVRGDGYRFLYLLSLEHPQYQSDVVDLLVLTGLSDNDPGNRKSVCRYLEDFPEEHFSVSARNRISSHAIEKDTPFEEIVRLSARLGLKDLASHYKHLLLSGSVDSSTSWTLHVALGRLGDEKSARWCVDQVKKMGMNDQVVHHLVPDLVFIQYKPAIDYLLFAICRDQQNCSSPNPDSSARINCAYRLMEVVAPAIKGFPVQTDESGNLQTNDYERALERVRDWINEHSSDYEMRES